MRNKKKKPKTQTTAKKMERTGTHTFDVKHDDGSVFECQVDDPKKFDLISGISGANKKSFAVNGLNTEKKPLICDKCKKRVYKIRIANGQALCDRCS